MSNLLLIIFGKFISKLFRLLNLGNGSTWPGHIALSVNKHFIRDLIEKSNLQIVVIAGTNGKTTTSSLIKHILEKAGKRVFQNQSGANLLNGIASTLLLNSLLTGKLPYDFAIFEVDENALPHLLKELIPDYLVLLNLFRDQLDRYGEVHTIADRWENALQRLTSPSSQPSPIEGEGVTPQNDSLAPQSGETLPAGRQGVRVRGTKPTLILNADDPEIAYLGLANNNKTIQQFNNILYFGLDDQTLSKQTRDHAVDSVYCPKCNFPLEYKENYYSHLGNWYCPNCKLSRPTLSLTNSPYYPLSGTYNQYNTHAALLTVQQIGISMNIVEQALHEFKPAFGRQESVQIGNKSVQIFLSKNPTSFNQSLETIKNLGAKNLLIVLNDRIADGHDVSWIWDTNLEHMVDKLQSITISGDRCHDMALRLKYIDSFEIGNLKFEIKPHLSDAINYALENTKNNETLYILPTYTAMLDVRKILTGKKIL